MYYIRGVCVCVCISICYIYISIYKYISNDFYPRIKILIHWFVRLLLSISKWGTMWRRLRPNIYDPKLYMSISHLIHQESGVRLSDPIEYTAYFMCYIYSLCFNTSSDLETFSGNFGNIPARLAAACSHSRALQGAFCEPRVASRLWAVYCIIEVSIRVSERPLCTLD